MSFVNYPLREMSCKIVYYGPGMCGKTTNVTHIHARTHPSSRGNMVSLATESERTLFFDFLPLNVGRIRGFKVRLQLYTVPGQVMYKATRQLILKGADGVVFIADSQEARREANLIALEDLRDNLVERGLSLDAIPRVVQYNKRDLAGVGRAARVTPVDALRAELNPEGVPDFEASATSGAGVFDTLKAIARLVLTDLARR